MDGETKPVKLRRVLSLWWLVFYGVGVTIGAGIFALIGDIVAIAGVHAPWAFLVAGLVAGFTAFSYAALSSVYPKAAGEAIYVKHAFASWAGRLVGYGLIVTGLLAGAVIVLAFGRYVSSFSGIPEWMALVAVLAGLAAIAIAGVRESVGFAALITVLEVGTLLLVVAVGLPQAMASPALWDVLTPPLALSPWTGVLAGGFLAFFAFIGFENIVNMAEETRDASTAIPKAVVLTLAISVLIYALVAIVAAAYPDPAALIASKAPLALLFETSTGRSGAAIAVMASIAMMNGILVQIIMASRVLYGMANEGMAPAFLGRVHASRQTPIAGIGLITLAIAGLALSVPLVRLASVTSLIILIIFTLVNCSLFILGRRSDAPDKLRRWRYWGLAGAAVSLALAVTELVS